MQNCHFLGSLAVVRFCCSASRYRPRTRRYSTRSTSLSSNRLPRLQSGALLIMLCDSWFPVSPGGCVSHRLLAAGYWWPHWLAAAPAGAATNTNKACHSTRLSGVARAVTKSNKACHYTGLPTDPVIGRARRS